MRMLSLLRAAAWGAGSPVRMVLIAVIRLYQLTLSGLIGGQCRFYPTCSRYAEEAIRVHGAVKGTAFAVWRLARCGPFSRGGVDHVPGRRETRDGAGAAGTAVRRGGYDAVIPAQHRRAARPGVSA